MSSPKAGGPALASSRHAVGTASELEEFAAESVAVVAPLPVQVRRPALRLGWILAAIALIQAPFTVLWVRNTWTPAATAEGRLRLETQPSGVEVRVDGQVRGRTPLNLALAPGAHSVEVRQGEGWRAVPVTIAAGADLSQYLEVTGVAAAVGGQSGSLQVTTEPPRALVTVDGIERGRSPITIDNLAAGEHQVLLQLPTETRRRTVLIEAGSTASLIVSAAAAPTVSSGWLAFNSRVPLQIFEGGQLVGTSEVERLMLTAGRHDLDLVNDTLGFRARRTVTVQSGQVTPVSLDLPTATLSINAQPWADVWVDGESVGQTPIGNLTRTIGAHEIVFRHPQFGERRMTATVTLREPARIAVDLRRP